MKRRLTLTSALFIATAALVYQVGCGSSSPSPAGPSGPPVGGGGASTTIAIVGINGSNSFSPNPASVAVGGTVTWRNSDPGGNVHHIVADNGSWDAGSIGPGGTGNTVTVGSGPIPYHCMNHPSMVGTINGSQGTGPSGPGY